MATFLKSVLSSCLVMKKWHDRVKIISELPLHSCPSATHFEIEILRAKRIHRVADTIEKVFLHLRSDACVRLQEVCPHHLGHKCHYNRSCLTSEQQGRKPAGQKEMVPQSQTVLVGQLLILREARTNLRQIISLRQLSALHHSSAALKSKEVFPRSFLNPRLSFLHLSCCAKATFLPQPQLHIPTNPQFSHEASFS